MPLTLLIDYKPSRKKNTNISACIFITVTDATSWKITVKIIIIKENVQNYHCYVLRKGSMLLPRRQNNSNRLLFCLSIRGEKYQNLTLK